MWSSYLNEKIDEVRVVLHLATESTQKHDLVSLSRTCTYFATDTHQPLHITHDYIQPLSRITVKWYALPVFCLLTF